jgi:ketosteroid isomerase-like protein
MRKAVFRSGISAVLAAIFLAVFSAAQTADLKSQLSDLVQAEISFSKTAGEKGIREAFLVFLAERSLVFRPMPVDGRKNYEESPADSGTLSWYPVIADISRTGDLGYTTGPYEYRPERSGDPVRHGNYASVWRRQSDGIWKVILDCGTANPAPPASQAAWQPPATLEPVFDPAGLRLDPAVERRKLRDTDIAFSEMARGKRPSAAYQTYLAPGSRYLRPGILPVSGKKEISAIIARSKTAWSWQPADSGVAAGGDLGYTYGRMSDASGATAYYMRVWKRDPTGAWHVLLDVANPLPAPKK